MVGPARCLKFQTRYVVMPGLAPGIRAFLRVLKTWMAGTSPAVTIDTEA
jgi:hypothetical protein